jgi:hypothetical protein
MALAGALTAADAVLLAVVVQAEAMGRCTGGFGFLNRQLGLFECIIFNDLDLQRFLA